MNFNFLSRTKKNKRTEDFRRKSQKAFKSQHQGGDKTLRFRDPEKEEKVPLRNQNYQGTFLPAFPYAKFSKTKEAANLYCPYSTTDYVTNQNVSGYTAKKRVDTTTPVMQREEAKKIWSSRLICNEEVDVYKLLEEAGLVLEILDGKQGTRPDNAENGQGLFNHYRCHLINCKAVRKVEKESNSRNKKNVKNSFLLWKESEINQIEIIAPTRLTTTGNETISMQLNYYLQSQGAKRVPEQQLVQFCYQICLGLKWFHENGIVYKDLRCRNVLVEKRGHNWLSRIMAPGQGSLVKYVKDGYGWRNIKNGSIHQNPNNSKNYSEKVKQAGETIGPLSEPTDINTVLINRPLSRPPGKDRWGINKPQDDTDAERMKSLRGG